MAHRVHTPNFRSSSVSAATTSRRGFLATLAAALFAPPVTPLLAERRCVRPPGGPFLDVWSGDRIRYRVGSRVYVLAAAAENLWTLER